MINRHTKYFGAVGNRDHIKIDGVKRPFHEFLNVQPDGWLTSLVYAKGFHRPPHTNRMIFDCGAWSYRNEDEPSVNVESVVSDYTQMCNAGDLCVAPDHMLIPGADVGKRQRFNAQSARDFISKLPERFTPMGIVHGIELNDRVRQAAELYRMGYRHIGIGGIAARASSPKYCYEVVRLVRNAFPDAYVHVMGLSSPNYYAEWDGIGIDSCDGSSHFKQAFTGGAFFGLDWSGKLVKFQAARRDNDSVIPGVHCDCNACHTLKDQGVDTRSYGSNEHNMGRAVHNMNMLMTAQRAKVNGIFYLVSCVGQKESAPTEARNLYTSAWFKKARAIAESHGSRWGILSAKHGFIAPDDVVAPYEQTLSGDTNEWAKCVFDCFDASYSGEAVFILAGERYRKHLVPLLHQAGIPTYIPLSGMGIGQQLAAMTPAPAQQELSL